jgi:hypothetical protein
MNIIDQYLPKLKNSQIHQHVYSGTAGVRDEPCYVAPYHDKILPNEHDIRQPHVIVLVLRFYLNKT